MRVRLPALAAASLFLAACGGGGTPAPAGLAYSLPNPAMATYVTGDTMTVDIDAGGQQLQMRVSASAEYGATFARSADGIQITMTVDEYSGRMTQPMGGPVTYAGEGIDGPVVFSLDRQGNATLIESPTLSGEAETNFTPLTMAHTFFPRLPGGAVAAGDMWTDTIRYQGPESAGEVSVIMAMEYTAVGDTMVDGQSLLKITFTGTGQSDSEGSMAGTDFTQSVESEFEGHVLWDMSSGLMVEHFTDTDGRGSMEVAVAPFPLSIRARGQRIVRLSGGM